MCVVSRRVRALREQQDLEYQEVLAADQKRAEMATEESERVELESELKREEEEREVALEKRRGWERRRKVSCLPLEPPADGTDSDVVNVAVRLVDGTTISRRFSKDNTVQVSCFARVLL